MSAKIEATAYYLPPKRVTNADLSAEFPEWSVDKISAKTGIDVRHVASETEFSSDLAVAAGNALFAKHALDPATVDYLIVCTQTPDYYMPTTAVLVHDQLGLRSDAGATDITLGCSGYIYALGLAKGLIESGQVSSVLIITADTYSKFINPADKSVRTIFGDGAAATLVSDEGNARSLSAFTYGSDGGGGKALIVPNGGLRQGTDIAPKSSTEVRGLESNGYDLYMDGPEIFNFTLRVVPASIDTILLKAELELADIDLFVFHQANAFMLDHLRKRLGIDEDRFVIALRESGNTVSSTIPIALTQIVDSGRLKPGMKVMLLGFGVGLSWGGLVVEW